ncbi:hypothetical protein [Rhizobium sp. RCAM05973]|uniref:hypothetical protein n=1 Tax=Rhizobium sp. RCAM05973 TaxID=2994066 RepID=UPI0022EBB2AC|nr:hypothetical protein [Rhizobium sp. RCAM05973]
MKTDLWELTARELTDGYGTGMFTPLEALTSIEGRLDAVNANIKAVIAEDRGRRALRRKLRPCAGALASLCRQSTAFP